MDPILVYVAGPYSSDPEGVCSTCAGTGEIDETSHPDHPSNTGDGADETWCIDCDGIGTRDAYEAKSKERK